MKSTILIFFVLISCTLFAQDIKSDNAQLVDAYKLAINTVDINTRRGILAAGADYGGEWTRDISISTWFGLSLIRPQVAEKSLWSVTLDKDSIGHQYWDKILWSIAALNHYKVTGNVEFLKQAYSASLKTINSLEKYAFDKDYGLFTGPSVISDGIAGYPEPIYDSTNNSSFILDHKNSKNVKCANTNCVYYGAYNAIAEMGKILNADKRVVQSLQTKAAALKANILKHYYSPADNKIFYLIL